jgi:serine protease Do
LSFDRRAVRVARELPRIVAGEPRGKRVDVVILREGVRKSLSVTIAAETEKPPVSTQKPPGPVAEDLSYLLLGLRLAPLTANVRRLVSLSDDVRGVIVVDVAEGSLAAREDLQPCDIIQQVDRHEVTQPAEVRRAILQATAKGESAVLFLIARRGKERYLGVSVGKKTRPFSDMGAYASPA